MAPKKQMSVSRGSTPMSMSENHQGSYSKWLRLQRGVHIQCQCLGVFIFLLVYQVTPHMLKMTTLSMKFSGAFMDNDFV